MELPLGPTGSGWLWLHFKPTSENLFAATSPDASTWTTLSCSLTPRSGTRVRDPNGWYDETSGFVGVCYTIGTFGEALTAFDIAVASPLDMAFTVMATVDCSSIVSGAGSNARIWGPRRVALPDGRVFFTVSASVGGDSGPFVPYYAQCLDNVSFSSFSAWQQITGTSLPSSLFDNDLVYEGGLYTMFYKNELGGKYVEAATSSDPFSGFTPVKTGNWTGTWGTPKEGNYIIRSPNGDGKWRAFLDAEGGGYFYSDSTTTGLLGGYSSLTQIHIGPSNYTPQNGKIIPLRKSSTIKWNT